MSDKIVTATAADHAVSIVFCNLKETCDEAIKLQNLKGIAAETLSRALIAGALLSSTLKNDDDKITFTIHGNGPVKGLTVTADYEGNLRGYLYNSEAKAPSVSELIGPGILSISKDIGLREPYNGQLPLVSGEIAEDLTAYFAESEQTPSSCGIGVLLNDDGTVKAAGGFLIQLLPNTPYSVIDDLEEDLSRHPSPTKLLLEFGDDFKALLKEMLPLFHVKILEEDTVQWHCNCSRDRITKALISVGKKELESLIEDGEDTEVVCDFCRTKYTFTPDQVKEIYESI